MLPKSLVFAVDILPESLHELECIRSASISQDLEKLSDDDG
jgi:hypothetical protein